MKKEILNRNFILLIFLCIFPFLVSCKREGNIRVTIQAAIPTGQYYFTEDKAEIILYNSSGKDLALMYGEIKSTLDFGEYKRGNNYKVKGYLNLYNMDAYGRYSYVRTLEGESTFNLKEPTKNIIVIIK